MQETSIIRASMDRKRQQMRNKWFGWLYLALCIMPAARAAEEPLWEIGAGAALMTLPDYRGADEGRTYLLPIPYFTYNGERFRVDRRGAHGDLIQKNNVWLDI